MSYPARDNQITFGAVMAWLLVLVLAIVVLFFIFKKEVEDATTQDDGWISEEYATPGFDLPKDPLARIADMEWLLIELQIEGKDYALSDEVATTFRCDTNGRFGGNAGCNNYFGQLQFDPEHRTITIGPAASTMMACPPPKGQQEGAYLRTLEHATRIEIGGHHLRLSSGDNSSVLLYALLIPDEMGAVDNPGDEPGPTPGQVPDQGNIDVDAQTRTGGKAARATMIYRGTLKLEGEALSFRPCDADFTVLIENGRFDLVGVANEMGLNLPAGIYAELRAQLLSHNGEGARLQLTDPLLLANEGGSCKHPGPVASMVASGNEPFWTLVVGEQSTTLKTPKGEWRLSGSMHPDDAFFSSPGGQRSITFTDEAQGIEVDAVFEKIPCRDSMVDAWSAFSAQVTMNGESGKGCARPGRFLPSTSGRYSATLPAASSPGRRLDLMLYDSGLATLSTDFQNDEPVIQQQGIWQQRDASTVQIQFMTLNGKSTFDRMVFTSDANSLVAVEFDPQHWGDQGVRLSRIVNEGK